MSIPADKARDDYGPWRMIVGNDEVTLYSDDFTHDVAITITGDFADNAERIAYATSIQQRLSLLPSSGRDIENGTVRVPIDKITYADAYRFGLNIDAIKNAAPQAGKYAAQEQGIRVAPDTLNQPPAAAPSASAHKKGNCPLCRAPFAETDMELRQRVAEALSRPCDLGTVLDPTDERLKAFTHPERERIIATMAACEGISTSVLEQLCPDWLDVVKVMEERVRELTAASSSVAQGVPTMAMIEAGELVLREYEKNPEGRYFTEAFDAVTRIYAAMVNAAPSASTQREEKK